MTSIRPCSTEGCRWRSGDPSGQCWQCRTAQPGYLAQLHQQVETGMAAEYAAHPEWREAATARQAETEGPSPFRFFHADVIRKECPECGWVTGVGFDSPYDPGAQTRKPAKCLQCSAADIHQAAIEEATAAMRFEVCGLAPGEGAGSSPGPSHGCPGGGRAHRTGDRTMTSASGDKALYELNFTDAEWEAWRKGATVAAILAARPPSSLAARIAEFFKGDPEARL